MGRTSFGIKNMKHRPVCYVLAIISLNVACVATAADKVQAYALKSKRSPQVVDRVEAILEVSGPLKVTEGHAKNQKKATSVDMKAVATLAYTEKSLKVPTSVDLPAQAIRYYEKADASIHVGDDAFKPTLRDERRLIGVEVRSPKVVMFCPKGPLTREELDLVDLLGNSLIFDMLLPPHAVAVGESWKHPDKLLAALVGMNTVEQSDAQSVLQSVADGVAQIEMAGYVAGSVNGLSSTIQLKAKYRFDTKAERITWFALLVKENREPGPIGPGLDVVARVQVRVTPGVECSQLSKTALEGLPLEPSAPLQQLTYASADGGWEMTYDRRWIVISEKKDLTILRMADRGAYLAQCNLSSSGPGEGKQVTLAEFQDDIRRALAKNFRQFVKASQTVTEAEYQVYRVAVQGEASGVPIEWIYYRVADKRGRQVVVLFTVEANMGEKFEGSDIELVRAIRFSDAKVATKPQAKPQAGAQSK